MVKHFALFFVALAASSPAFAQRQGPAGGGIAVSAVETKTVSVEVAGRLEPARRIAHTVSVAGIVREVYARVGDRVTTGQVLALIARDEPGESYRPLSVVSRLSGRVSEASLVPGAEVKAGAEAFMIVDDSEYRLVAALSDKDAHRVAAMGTSAVVARASDGLSLRGELTGVSTEPDYGTGLFTATMRFSRQPGVRIGAALFVDLPVESVRGQFVQRDLIVRRFGRGVLWVVDAEGRLKQAEVTTGKPYGEYVQVLSGLAPGTPYPSRLTGFEKEGLSLEEYLEAGKKGS